MVHCCARQELSQWRQQQLQESLRNSVLDEEAAAKFSTAAALAAKEKRSQMAKANYDKGLLTAIDQDEKAREVSSPREGFLRECLFHELKLQLSSWNRQKICVRGGTSTFVFSEADAYNYRPKLHAAAASAAAAAGSAEFSTACFVCV